MYSCPISFCATCDLYFIQYKRKRIYGKELDVCASDFGLYSKLACPLYLLLVNSFCMLGGTPALFSTIAAIGCCYGLSLVFLRLTRSIKITLFFTTLFSISIEWIPQVVVASPIPIAMLFFVFFVYFIISWYENPNEIKMIYAMIGLIASSACHPFFLIFIPLAIVFLIVSYKQYNLDRNTLFFVGILVFLGLNLFLLIPFINWNHNSAPTNFSETIAFLLPEFSFVFSFSQFNEKLALFVSSTWGVATSSNLLLSALGAIVAVIVCVVGLRLLKQTKSAVATLLAFIVVFYTAFFSLLLLNKISLDMIQEVAILSLPLTIVLYICLAEIAYRSSSKWIYSLCGILFLLQTWGNFPQASYNDFLQNYCNYIVKNTEEDATIIVDSDLYWYLFRARKCILVTSSDDKKKVVKELFKKQQKFYLTYVDPRQSIHGYRLYQNGLLWSNTKIENKDIPGWTIPKVRLNQNQQNLVSRYHYLKALRALDKGQTQEVLILVNLAQHHSQLLEKKLPAYAQSLSSSKKYSEAISVYSYLNTRAKKTQNYHVFIARIKNVQGKLKEAEKYYKLAIKASPKHFYAHIELAKIYEKKNDIQKARRIYEKLLEFYPKHAYVYKKLAQIYASSEDSKERKKAKDFSEKAKKLEQKKSNDKEQLSSQQPKIPKPKNILPQIPKVPRPQDFYPKIPTSNYVPGREKR